MPQIWDVIQCKRCLMVITMITSSQLWLKIKLKFILGWNQKRGGKFLASKMKMEIFLITQNYYFSSLIIRYLCINNSKWVLSQPSILQQIWIAFKMHKLKMRLLEHWSIPIVTLKLHLPKRAKEKYLGIWPKNKSKYSCPVTWQCNSNNRSKEHLGNPKIRCFNNNNKFNK